MSLPEPPTTFSTLVTRPVTLGAVVVFRLTVMPVVKAA